MSQSIHCSGANTASGGEYEEIHCSGSLKIQGDTACQALQNSGALKLAGSLVCTEELHSSGALRAVSYTHLVWRSMLRPPCFSSFLICPECRTMQSLGRLRNNVTPA